MNHFLSPGEVTALYAQTGGEKTRKPASVLLLLAVLAGALIALAGAATNTAVYGIADVWTARTICGLLFPFGLCMVVVLGAELFTGNCLISISLLDRQCSLGGLLRNWVIVYAGNLLGSLLVAWGCVSFGQLNYSGGLLGAYTIKVAAGKCAIPFVNGVGLGFFCNMLVCAGVLMALSGKDTTGRILGAFLPVCFFVVCGFEHCVANLFYIPAGLMAAGVPQYAQLAREMGVDLSLLTLGGMLRNLISVTLGNILGGAGLGALLWYCYQKKHA